MHLNDSPRAGMLKLFKLVDMTCKEPFTCALVHWHLAHLFIIIKHRCNRLLRDSSALIAKYNDFPRMPSKENNSYFTSTGSQRERKSKPPGLSRFLLSYAADKGHPKFSLGSGSRFRSWPSVIGLAFRAFQNQKSQIPDQTINFRLKHVHISWKLWF